MTQVIIDIFEECRTVASLLEQDNEPDARDKLISLLDQMERLKLSCEPLVNHLIRRVGLYPYIDQSTASWQERVVCEAFNINICGKEITLHREQSRVLKRLVEGNNIIVSAPTSFGKSFIVDAFIAIKQPINVVIIVPTIALTDEIRRRLQKKFSENYKIITTSDVSLGERNILIFPQERAMQYVSKLDSVDMLIVDEFYKADPEHDKQRSPALLRAILHFQQKAKQRYFLAPNISEINSDTFTQGMEFVKVDFSTVFLRKHDLCSEIAGDEGRKSAALIKILSECAGKTLIYAGTYAAIKAVGVLVRETIPESKSGRLSHFADWLSLNYTPAWPLIGLIKRGAGIHSGDLHRSIGQLQIKLFEDETDGLNIIISTSSIIEGVNTSAQNVILWNNKNGRSNLKDFSYRNIIGRAGRMFKHFVGEIYILAKPPEAQDHSLQLEFPDSLIGEPPHIIETVKQSLTKDQVAKIIAYEDEMRRLVGSGFDDIQNGASIATSDWNKVREIAGRLNADRAFWKGIGFLNSDNPDDWGSLLMQALNASRLATGISYTSVVSFIKIISRNWEKTIPQLLGELGALGLGIDDFFDLERTVSHTVAGLLGDINILHRHIFGDEHTDIGPFITQLSTVFLPPVVYDLEEYGLPRMLSRKIQDAGLISFENKDLKLEDALIVLTGLGAAAILRAIRNPHPFDGYILNHFFDGLRLEASKDSSEVKGT